MIYEISTSWLILLVFVTFTFGVLVGLSTMKRKITEVLLKKLSINDIEQILDDKHET